MPTLSIKEKERPIFAADDWGLNPFINQGIAELAAKGRLGWVSLLANFSTVEWGLQSLLSHNSNIKWSVHTNFTEGTPLSPAKEIPSLVTTSGKFPGLRGFLWRWARGQVQTPELIKEAQAQIQRLRWLGVPLTTADSHHHVHLLPGLFQPLLGLWQQEGLNEVRVMTDPTHKPSWWCTKWSGALTASSTSLHLSRFAAPKTKSLENIEFFYEKFYRSTFDFALIHPADYSHLDRKVADPLLKERHKQYELLMKESRT